VSVPYYVCVCLTMCYVLCVYYVLCVMCVCVCVCVYVRVCVCQCQCLLVLENSTKLTKLTKHITGEFHVECVADFCFVFI
jgi:hypothetical protein